MRAPADRAGDAAHEGLADHQVADAAFVVAAAVVDDEHVTLVRCGDRLEKHVGAAGMAGRPRRARGFGARDVRPQSVRPDTNRQRELHTRIGDERSGPIKIRKTLCIESLPCIDASSASSPRDASDQS